MRRVKQRQHDFRLIPEIRHRSGVLLRGVHGCRLALLTLPLFPALCILGTSCISQNHMPYRGSQAPRFVQWTLPEGPENPRFRILAVAAEGTRTHAVVRLYRRKPCGDSSENELGALAYLSRTPGTKRWVVVLPIWGRSTFLKYPSHKIVRWLLNGAHGRETNVLWIQGPTSLVRYAAFKKTTTEAEFLAEISRTASCIDATIKDVRAFIDWMMMQPDTDPRRVGIVGFSIGGIVARPGHGSRPTFGGWRLRDGGRPSG
jgi:hypothetical protein